MTAQLTGVITLQDRMSPTLRSVLGLTVRLTTAVNEAHTALQRLGAKPTAVRVTLADGVSKGISQIERQLTRVGQSPAMKTASRAAVAQQTAAVTAAGTAQQTVVKQTSQITAKEQADFQKRATAFLDRQQKAEVKAAQATLVQQARGERLQQILATQRQRQEERAQAAADKARQQTITKLSAGMQKIGAGFVNTVKTVGSNLWNVVTAPVRMLTSLPGLLGMGGGVYAIKSLVGGALDFSASMEQAQIGFTTMLKSASKARDFVGQLFDFAARTPFQFPQVQSSARTMLAMGFNTNEILPDLTAIGNAISALGGSSDVLDRVVMSIGQIKTTGKLTGREVRELALAGIPVMDILSEKLGLAKNALGDIGNLSISSDKALQALFTGMNERFGNGMQMQSRSWNGLWTTLKDNAMMILGSLGDGIRDKIQPKLAGLTDWLGKNESAVNLWKSKLYMLGWTASKSLTDAVEGAMTKIGRLLESPAWASAGLGGKIGMLWEELIGKPFSAWWAGPGKDRVTKIAHDMGDFLGSMIGGAVSAVFGVKSTGTSMVGAGATAGAAFVDGFISAIKKVDWGEVMKSAFNGQNVWGKLFMANMMTGGAISGVATQGALWGLGALGKFVWGKLATGGAARVATSASGRAAAGEATAAAAEAATAAEGAAATGAGAAGSASAASAGLLVSLLPWVLGTAASIWAGDKFGPKIATSIQKGQEYQDAQWRAKRDAAEAQRQALAAPGATSIGPLRADTKPYTGKSFWDKLYEALYGMPMSAYYQDNAKGAKVNDPYSQYDNLKPKQGAQSQNVNVTVTLEGGSDPTSWAQQVAAAIADQLHQHLVNS